jgi:hypothetical protein
MEKEKCQFHFVKKVFKVIPVRPDSLKKFPALLIAGNVQCCGQIVEAGRYFGLYECQGCGRLVEDLEEKFEDLVVFRCAQCGAEKKFIIPK